MAQIIRIRCGGCQVKIKAPLKYQGRKIQCPQCGFEINIPVLQEIAPAPAAKPQAVVSVAAATPMILDDPPKKKGKPKEQPMQLGDDAFAETAADPWDLDPAEFEDYEDFETKPKPKRKKPSSAGKKKPVKRKPAKASAATASGGSTDWVDQGSIFGGIAMMVGAAIWFFWGLKNDIFFFYPPVLFIAGIVALVKGLMGD